MKLTAASPPGARHLSINWQRIIVDMVAEHEAAQLLVYRAVWLKDQGLPKQHQTFVAELFASESRRPVPSGCRKHR